MYWEWTTLAGSGSGSEKALERASVLEKLPIESAKDCVIPVVRHIVSTLGISQPALPSTFNTDNEVDWCLQVVCYGLSLPFSEHEIIKDCVSIYCEWLSCLAPIPKISVPKPITERPDFYARKIINQLYHLFTPRKGEAQDTINRQAVLCHRVLRTLQNTIKSSELLNSETWECILLFLIAINDALLSPPSIKDDIGDQLCERTLSVLFEAWLFSCGNSGKSFYPSPPLWKTLNESCQAWRHRANLFDQWNRINLLLTGRALNIMYGPGYVKLGEDDGNLVPATMTDDCIVQTWFRFLHVLGNPVELTQPTIISQTQNFLQFAIASEAVIDPCQHPCLSVLPSIFHQSMKGIAALVDAFLGIPPREMESAPSENESHPTNPSPIPPVRRLAKSFSVATSSTSSNVHKGLPRTSLLGITTARSKDTSSIPSSHSSMQSIASASAASSSLTHGDPNLNNLLRYARPKVNSILHLFGPWLFEAALISCDSPKKDGEVRRASRGSAVPAALPESIDIPHAITIDKYYLGRAEALAILCRIFCSKKTGEEILPSYLARFYIAVYKGLKETRQEVIIPILFNSSNLLRVDLDGVSVLIPAILKSLEAVLPSKDALRNDRKQAIQLLLSLLSLPLHFLNVPIKEVLDKSAHATTFIQLKPRLANLLINALQVETDSLNIQMLLGGLLMSVNDISAFEEVDKATGNSGAESPTNLLSSENTSMRSFSDYSNSFDEHTLGFSESGDAHIDSAHALFVRATYLVCHRLISTWKIDLPVSLAALELLNGLARIRIKDQDPLECRRAVKWICDFIIHQCSRPPPAHSKDLHSSIVAAFQCVTTWLTAHPYLLEEKETLYTVLEVVEYGISGTKSQGKPGEPVKLKDEKELKPVSLRVRDAAEALLAVIFEQVGRYTPNNGVKTSSLVDEFVLLNQVHTPGTLSKEEIVNHFRYFVIDHTILIALLEEPLGNDQDPQPTCQMVLRGPTGRHAWTLQLRHMPRYKGKSFSSSGNPGRPLPMNDVGIRYDNLQHRYFPESADRIVPCKADKAIPSLDSANSNSASADQDSLEQSRLSIILENQIRLEKSVANMIREEADESYNLRTEAQPPPVSQEYQTARLLLSHLGFISVQDGPNFTLPKLAAIDSRHPDFITELETLDSTSCRTCDTVHVFYVRAGQRKSEEILANVQSKANIHPHFLEFLLSLGWAVNISHHAGWTGNVHSSWKRLNQHVSSVGGIGGQGIAGGDSTKDDSTLGKSHSSLTPNPNEIHGGSLYNGDRWVLYWADVTSEIAFVVPTGKSANWSETTVWNVSDSAVQHSNVNPSGPGSLEKSCSDGNPPGSGSSSMEFEKHLGNSAEASRAKKALSGKLCDTKIFVVWVESFEDSFHFPAGDLMGCCTYTGLEGSNSKPVEPSLIIFIHALRNGLFRIRMEGESLRMGLATPLIDGMVCSRRVLGNLVRQTSLNMARRKRLENENFQPPHVRRKLKIQEISNKFTSLMTPPEFYTHFFQSPTISGQQQESEEQPGLTTVHHV